MQVRSFERYIPLRRGLSKIWKHSAAFYIYFGLFFFNVLLT